jgi:GDP-L-fucose synthase
MTKIFVAGHRGMVGSAICRQLELADVEIITANRDKLDLANQAQVAAFFGENKFDQVYLAAAKVGGIHANNTYPADFIYQNLMIQNNIIHSSYQSGVMKLLFLGSSCIYPKLAKQPIAEHELLNGHLEQTNEPYAIAKIAGIKMCESYNRQYGTDYRSVMPTNLYGPGDNYHAENSHVIPALIRRFHEAKIANSREVIAWGTGSALREFLHVDDMAAASVFVMNLGKVAFNNEVKPTQSHLNVGTGLDCSIKKLTEIIAKVVGFQGSIIWDETKPDGAPRKLMDSKKLNEIGWYPLIDLKSGLDGTYKNYVELANHKHFSGVN